MLGRLRKNRKEREKMKKVCLFLLMLLFAISTSSKDFKYHPKTKDELKELIENEAIYLGDIDTSAITDIPYLFISSPLENRKPKWEGH